eukprot:1085302-Rhodomonas_salina.1
MTHTETRQKHPAGSDLITDHAHRPDKRIETRISHTLKQTQTAHMSHTPNILSYTHQPHVSDA